MNGSNQDNNLLKMATKKANLLVVDDNQINLEIMNHHLSEIGLQVKTEKNPKEVLGLIEKENFDLVLLDIIMPEISGIDILKKIRMKYNPLELPVIMVTDRNEEMMIAVALNLGANDYLTKPFNITTGLARIENALMLKMVNANMENLRISKINEAKMETLLEMASSMAHEINNPLTILTGKLLNIQNKIKDDTIKPDIKKVLEMVDKISDVLKGLRSFASADGGRTKTQIYLREILESTLDICRNSIENNGIGLKIEYLDKEIKTMGNLGQLNQALYNVIKNSLKIVKTHNNPWIKIVVDSVDGSGRISIIDSGLGINPNIQDKIFLPFFTTDDIGGGMGLGLSTARGIMDSHNGSLILDAKYPNTKFIFNFSKVS